MAGVIAMGDLSHELETLVLQIDSGAVAGDEHAHAVMQASLDELSRMRDLVSAGTLPGEARDLIAQIRGLANQPAVATAAVATATIAQAAAEAAAPASAVVAPAAAATPTAPAPPPSALIQPPAARAPLAPPARAAAPESSLEPAAQNEDASSSMELSSAPVLPGREAPPVERVEMARVDADLLDTMLNNAGEVEHFSRPPRSAGQFH